MKRSILSFLLVSLTFSAIAQRNRVTAHLYQSSTAYIKSEDTTGLAYSIQENTELRPALGYYHLIGENWGIGIEAGYTHSKIENTGRVETPYDPEVVDGHDLISQKEIYIAPCVYEQVDFDRYRFTGSLSIPITRTYDIMQDSWTNYSTRFDPTIRSRSHNINGYPSRWNVGLSCNGGVQRQIVGGVYLGFDVGVGYNMIFSKGERTTRIFRFDQPNEPEKETYWKGNMQERYSNFVFRAALSLSFYF